MQHPIARAALAAIATALLVSFGAGSALADPGAVPPQVLKIAKSVHTAPGDLPRLVIDIDGVTAPLPLRETRVFAELSTHVAQVSVTQTYQNDFARPIEARYVFPLPENSAVDDMQIQVGGRVIQAEIQERAQAQRTFDAARLAGHTAALLAQDRPNIFTQQVANIPPGETIEITVRFVQPLSYDKGEYEWVFPMVVGPRFIPGKAIGRSAPGWALDTDQVPDASRITPPIIGEGRRTGHDIDIEVVVDSALPIVDVQTPTHAVDAHTHADGVLNLRLSEADRIPNRDFVLRYRVDGDASQVAVQSHKGERAGHFALTVQPPNLDVDALVGQRELIFVVDVSGSMFGRPISQAKAAARAAIAQLRPVDTFNLYTFAGVTAKAFKHPRPANEANVRAALAFLDDARAGGGTRLDGAVQAALSPPVDGGRHRYVAFLTDGYIGNATAIFAQAKALVERLASQGQRARVFGLGIGNSVNRHLITGLGEAGKGLGLVLTLDEREETAVRRMYRLIDHPVLQDVRIDWGVLPVEQVYPSVLPDVLASRPLVVYGQYAQGGEGVITVRAKTQDGAPIAFKLPVELPEQSTHGAAIASLWARARVEELSRQLWSGHDQAAVDAIVQTGIEHRLVTAYTSFVAVDRSRVVEGEAVPITQPVERADGVDVSKASPAAVGIHRALGSGVIGRGPLRNVFKKVGAFGSSMNAAMSGTGDVLVIGHGAGGMGLRGIGPGRVGEAAGFGRAHGMGRIVSRKSKGRRRPRGIVANAEPSVTGSLDKHSIQRVIRARSRGIRYCYEKALLAEPTLAGRVAVAFRIKADGRVVKVTIDESTLKNKQVEGCIKRAIKRWRFPKPAGGGVVEVKYPFVFAAKPAATEPKRK